MTYSSILIFFAALVLAAVSVASGTATNNEIFEEDDLSMEPHRNQSTHSSILHEIFIEKRQRRRGRGRQNRIGLFEILVLNRLKYIGTYS